MSLQNPGFIFDMDGTLVENMTFHVQAWQRFLADMGIEMTEAEIHQQTHGTIEEIIRRICGNHLSDLEVAALGEQKETLYRTLYQPHLRPIRGLVAFLRSAQDMGIPMAIGTSAGHRNINFVLEGLNIAGYFSACVGGDDVTQGKPHPETFLTAVQRLRVTPECCVVFEDTLSGIEAA